MHKKQTMKKIMKFFDVIYYNFYLHYRKRKFLLVKPEREAWYVLSSCFVNIVIGVSSSICRLLQVKSIYMLYFCIVGCIAITFLSYLYYIKNNRYTTILKTKPIIKSPQKSKIITIAFFVFSFIPIFVLLPIVSSFR